MASDLRDALKLEQFNLPDGWSWKWLDDVMDIQGGAQPPASTFIDHSAPGFVRFIQIRDFDGDNHLTYIKDSPKWRRCSSRDVLIARYGASLGRILRGLEGAYNVALVKVIPKGVDLDFLFCLLKSEFFQVPLAGLGARSVQAGFNKNDLATIGVPIPSFSEQQAIASILSTLDEKIELNQRMNQTLEAMVQAIFKSWFVDFDPVRAKMDGRWKRGESLPGLPAHLYDFFPDRLVDSELGEIPEGWEVGSFRDIMSQRSQRVGEQEAVVLSAIASGRLIKSNEHFSKRVYSEEIEKYLVVEQWDFAYNPSRINIGSIGMLEEALVGAVSPVYVVFRPAPAYRWFLEFSLRRSHTKEWINTLASGSVRQALSYSDFASIPCIIPPESLALQFDRVWTQLRGNILAHSDQSCTLAALRDTLLPRLLNGDLRVPE